MGFIFKNSKPKKKKLQARQKGKLKSRSLHPPLSPTSPGWRAGSPALPGHLHKQIRIASWF